MPLAQTSFDILYVGTLPPHQGGSAISGSLLLIGFAKRGCSVRALAPMTAEAAGRGDTFAACHPEIEVMRFLVPYFENSPEIPPPEEYRKREGQQIQEKLPGLIAHKRPDIILIGRETFAWHVPDIAQRYSIPCILRMAGATTMGLLNGSHSETQARRLLEQYRKVELLVTPAKHLAESVRQLGLQHIKTIANGVDQEQFSPQPKSHALLQELGIGDDEIVVMHVSNMRPAKRPADVVVSAQAALLRNPKLVYVIVGDGRCLPTLKEMCLRNGLADRVKFAGWVEYQRVPDYINLADIVVMPCETETQARVYLETQACARVLLASDIPGAREVVTHGETGLLFRKGDIEDLTTKTLLAASDPKLRAEIGRRSRDRVQAHSLDQAVTAYIATFREVLQHKAGGI
jgi:glycosyltransferase involved in cell wall biosynthesis